MASNGDRRINIDIRIEDSHRFSGNYYSNWQRINLSPTPIQGRQSAQSFIKIHPNFSGVNLPILRIPCPDGVSPKSDNQ
jgi:hypothetical protein